MTYELPPGWAEATLRDFAKVEWGDTSLTKKSYVSNGFPAFSASGQDGFLPAFEWEGPAVVLSAIGARCGKCFLAHDKWTAIKNTIVIQGDPAGIDHKLLFYYLNDERKWTISGSGQPFITMGIAQLTPFPFPPLAEQKRLVAKLDELLANVDDCRKRLGRIPIFLKRFRQSVLDAAFSGRLTADWRAQHSDVEPAAVIGSRINTVRTEGVSGKRAKQRSNRLLVEIVPEDECPEDTIPSTWTWVRFGSVIGELRNGLSQRPNLVPPGVPVLRISAARPGLVDLADVRYMANGEDFVPEYCLRDDDLLFTRYNGSVEFLGVCGMVRDLGEKRLLYPDKLMRVRFDHEFILPAYAELFFQVPKAHERIVAKSKSSAGQNGISGSDIKAQPFALAPLDEQQELVHRVGRLFALAHTIESRYMKVQQRVDNLSQAILAKAFRGELVPTEAELAEAEDREYETAEQLLKKIQSFYPDGVGKGNGKQKSKSVTAAL